MLLENIEDSVTLPCSALLSEHMSQEERQRLLDHYGAASEKDPVEFKLSVGSLVFDIYSAVVELPKAPYNRAQEQARRQRLAEEVTHQETLNLNAEVETALKQALTQDHAWSKVKIGVKLKNNNTEVFQSGALELFPKAREALLKVCQG